MRQVSGSKNWFGMWYPSMLSGQRLDQKKANSFKLRLMEWYQSLRESIIPKETWASRSGRDIRDDIDAIFSTSWFIST